MFNDFVKKCNETATVIAGTLRDIEKSTKEGFDFVGRKFQELTSTLPPDVRKFADESYNGLPYAIPLCSFIPPGLGILAAGVAVVGVKMFEDRLGDQTALQMYHGIRTFCAIGSAVDVARAAFTGNPVLLLSVPFYILFGAMAHQNAKDLQGHRLGNA